MPFEMVPLEQPQREDNRPEGDRTMAERLYAIRDPDEGLLDLFIRRSRSDLLKDFALGMHWPNLRRSMTDDEIDQMAAQRWASELEPEGYSVVPVRLVEVEEKG